MSAIFDAVEKQGREPPKTVATRQAPTLSRLPNMARSWTEFRTPHADAPRPSRTAGFRRNVRVDPALAAQ